MRMDNTGKEQIQKWALSWQKAGAELDRIHLQELRSVSVPAAIERLEDAFLSAMARSPERTSSGLVEQQRCFKRLH